MNNPVKVVNIYKDEYDIYMGRPGKGIKDAPFGNPHLVDRLCSICDIIHKRGEAVLLFYDWFYSAAGQKMRDEVKLKIKPGHKLGCFCKPKKCHADTIAEYVNNNYTQPDENKFESRDPWES